MSNPPSVSASASVFRVDKFVVPGDAMPAFSERLRRIQGLLGAVPGCRQNLVLGRIGGAGEFNMVTIVEWANSQAMETARTIVQQKYAEEGFDPASFMRELGVRADMGLYGNLPDA